MIETKKLSEIKQGQSAYIEKVGGEGALRQHLLDMGVIPGAHVKLIKFAPMGDPMELRIHGYELTLRLAEAENIEILLTDDEAGIYKDVIDDGDDEAEHPGLGEEGRYHEKEGEDPLPDGTTLTFALVGN
ncbi:MAG: ferrous iron transport protein A, partial [Mogibacterium sp.]|nr:ferrous iron transport protein A [Mogibacterium sp.]